MSLLNAYSVAAAALIAVGAYCVASKRNLIKIVMGIEIVTTAVNLNFIAMGLRGGVLDPLASMYAAVSMAIGAAVAALALALIVQAYRHYGTLDSSKMSRLRW
ncbi:MAG: hypothetical protein DRJ57_03785 [Thermoprotei archaeon]|mgnify:FL=1|nr:MAG: hypothetical protein DRJ57_03785 [Thermoprotei archaeon]